MQNTENLTFEIFSRSNQDTCLSQRPLVKQGQWVGKGQLLADCVNSVSGDLALGKNVLVAYMPWEGYNFEDSIVISDRLIVEDVYTSIHILRFKTEILNTNSNSNSKKVPTFKSLTSQPSKTSSSTVLPKVSLPTLSTSPSIQINEFHNNQKSRIRGKTSPTPTPKENKGYGYNRNPWSSDNFARSASSLTTLAVTAKTKASPASPEQTIKKYINNNSLGLEKRTRDVPFLGNNLLSHLGDNGIAKVGTWVSPGDVLVGKVRPLANKFKSNRASTQLAWEIISSRKNELMTMEDRSFRLPKGVSGRVIRTEILKHSSGEQIHVYLAVKRKIQIGDKLAGRHGNKGIVSLVLPKQDMPYLADGTPIDIILSPLGVPSRMNVGQIYECLLGLAARSLVCHFKVDNTMQTLSDLPFPIPAAKHSQESYLKTTKKTEGHGGSSSWGKIVDQVLQRTKLTKRSAKVVSHPALSSEMDYPKYPRVYALTPNTQTPFYRSKRLLLTTNSPLENKSSPPSLSMNTRKEEKQLLRFSSTLEARNLVFLKLYHSRITRQSKWLFSLAHPGKMRLFDGRTGQPFASWITVGYAYMLKLIHLVDNKMHSRSTGPYSLITRQPVTGKARHGGQRIGEMEAWALEGFGAAYTLQEFFSFKGDDVSSRNQWQVTSISQLGGNTTAFKTLFSQLRALCISVDFTGYTNS